MMHEVVTFLVYYLCAFTVHIGLHIKHPVHLPEWAIKSRAHKYAAVVASVGTAAGLEGVQGYAIHLIVYSGYIL